MISALWITLTIVVYLGSLRLQSRFRWAHPLVVSSFALVAGLKLARVSYSSYQSGAQVFSYLLGPATVALAVPMYKQALRMKQSLKHLFVVVLAGSMVGMATAGTVAWLCGAPRQVILSTLPKSVTTPIAIQISDSLHGNPTITAALVLVSGLLGSIAGPWVLRRAHVVTDHAIGSAIGTSSHAIGTASLVRHSEVQTSVSSLAMALAGVTTSILAMILGVFLRG